MAEGEGEWRIYVSTNSFYFYRILKENTKEKLIVWLALSIEKIRPTYD